MQRTAYREAAQRSAAVGRIRATGFWRSMPDGPGRPAGLRQPLAMTVCGYRPTHIRTPCGTIISVNSAFRIPNSFAVPPRRRILLIQLPIPQPGMEPAEGNVPLAAGYLKLLARLRGMEEAYDIEILPAELANRLSDRGLVAEILARDPWLVGWTCYLWNVERLARNCAARQTAAAGDARHRGWARDHRR